ncbi:hypothetical protein [Phreatobacter sp. AB_2022a]|uniref:hypothetical protein n=1 Tax=Phreatobacter sp. AB_2022a TaxID=3003134 RepID=UPI00228722DA|nr:hypothetical protein [Phreatobacter sp. AB_2022a]MCZ0732842.1 hypothetical protein [Phreatobacter sp. AB_2022a]
MPQSRQPIRPPRPFVDLSRGQIALLFVAMMAIVSAPILLHPLPPMSDYANHLARMHVIADGARDPDLSRFYQINWQIVPNLVMDVVVPALTRFMDVYLAGEIFLILTFLLIMSGTLAFNRALFGHWSALPLIGFPLLYNYVLLVGVLNYVFGFGLALWGLAAWVHLRERNIVLRLAVAALFVCALFFCHLYVVGVFGLGLLAIEIERLYHRRDIPLMRRLADFCATGIPFLPVLPLLRASPTWGLAADNSWEPKGKIDGLIYVIEIYSDAVAFALTGIVVVAAAWALRHKVLRFHAITWPLLVVSAIVYMAMPRVMFGSYLADQRLPVAVAYMLIACINVDLRHIFVRRGFIVVLLALIAVRTAEVQLAWAQLSRGPLAVQQSMQQLTRGAKVLVAYGERDAGDSVRDYGLVHAACLAIIERSALVTTAFTVAGKQIMHVRSAYRDRVDTEDGTPPTVDQLRAALEPIDSEDSHYWDTWWEHYDYVYVVFTDPDRENPVPDQLELVFSGPRFQLYKIIKDRPAAAPPVSGAPATNP